MSNKNEIFDKAFDLLLNEAAKAADERIGKNLSENAEEIRFSAEHERKMEQLFRRERQKQRTGKVVRYSMRAACILLVCVIAFGVTIFSVDAWRVKFLNFVLESGQPNTDYNFSDNGGTSYSDDNIILNYIPMGFELTNSDSTRNSLSLKFKCEKGFFEFSLSDIETNASIDTENGKVEKITVNGQEAIYTTNHNINSVIWHNDEYCFSVYGTITKSELIKIAENVKKQ